MKRTAIKRTRTKPRTYKTPRCSVQRCNKAARIEGMCVTHAERKADTLFSKWVRTHEPACTMTRVLSTPCGGPLQAAHGEPRGNHTVRYDPRNVHSVCRDHHMKLDAGSKHALKAEWLRALLGTEGYLRLVDHAMTPVNKNDAIESALHWLSGDSW